MRRDRRGPIRRYRLCWNHRQCPCRRFGSESSPDRTLLHKRQGDCRPNNPRTDDDSSIVQPRAMMRLRWFATRDDACGVVVTEKDSRRGHSPADCLCVLPYVRRMGVDDVHEFRGHSQGVFKAKSSISGKRAREEPIESSRQRGLCFSRRRELARADSKQNVCDTRASKGIMARNAAVQDCCQRPEIARRVQDFGTGLFGAHVCGRADQCTRCRDARIARYRLCDAKIQNLHSKFRVFWCRG